jgi:hypothetical protein
MESLQHVPIPSHLPVNLLTALYTAKGILFLLLWWNHEEHRNNLHPHTYGAGKQREDLLGD